MNHDDTTPTRKPKCSKRLKVPSQETGFCKDSHPRCHSIDIVAPNISMSNSCRESRNVTEDFWSPPSLNKKRGSRRSMKCSSQVFDEEALNCYADVDEPGDLYRDNRDSSQTSRTWALSVDSTIHLQGNRRDQYMIYTPPRVPTLISPFVYNSEYRSDVSPLSSNSATLFTTSLSSSEYDSSIEEPKYEYFELSKDYKRCRLVRPSVDDKFTSSECNKSSENCITCDFLPELHFNKTAYHCHRRVPVLWSLLSSLKDHLIQFPKLKGLTQRFLLFIILYSSSMFVVTVIQLNKYAVISPDVNFFRSQLVKERATRSRSTPRIFVDDESIDTNSVFNDLDGVFTVKKSQGGFHPAHNTREAGYTGSKLNTRSFSLLDIGMYDSSASATAATTSGNRPRAMHLHDKLTRRNGKRGLELVPTPFSDNSQLYGILSSDDPALSKMEPLRGDEDSECVSESWHSDYFPSCNNMHELDLLHLDDKNTGGRLELFKKQGYWRQAWKVDLPADSFILKTPRYIHNFEHAHYEHDRIDALAMSKLTFSPHVVDIFGFCGRSVMTEFAGGPRLGSVFDKARKKKLKRLEIAKNLAVGLAHVHYGINGQHEDESQFVHFDINPANIVVIDKDTLRINDFNIAKAIKRNSTSGEQCGVPSHHYPNAQWRSPEEVTERGNLSVKTDVFSLGHIFYRIVCGHEPWNKLENGGRPSSQDLIRKVGEGVLPRVPRQVLESKDPEIVAIREAMFMCYTVDVNKRPTSKEIANFLNGKLESLQNV